MVLSIPEVSTESTSELHVFVPVRKDDSAQVSLAVVASSLLGERRRTG